MESEEDSDGDSAGEQGEAAAAGGDIGWAPLLLAFMYEYKKPTSDWAPYFALLPTPAQLQHPHFWAADERALLLAGTGLVNGIEKKMVERKYMKRKRREREEKEKRQRREREEKEKRKRREREEKEKRKGREREEKDNEKEKRQRREREEKDNEKEKEK